jgi:hypothetical protein
MAERVAETLYPIRGSRTSLPASCFSPNTYSEETY